MIVPFNQSPATRQARGVPEGQSIASPPDVFLAMAAAQMHEQGRLFEPQVQEAKLSINEASPTKNLSGLRDIEQRAKEKLQKSRDDFDSEINEFDESNRKFYEKSTPEMLGPRLEELYMKRFGPRRKPTGEPMS